MKNGLLQIAGLTLAIAGMSLFGGCKDPGSAGSTGSTTGSSTSGSGGTGGTASGDTIKIGMVASRNGELRPWGTDCESGGVLAVKLINDAGGIGGKKIELIVEDSNSKPEEGKSAAAKLAGDGVVAIIGEVASGITKQMKIVALEKGIPMVAVGATNPDITKDGKGLISRVCYTDDLQGPVMAKFAYDRGLRRVAVMTDKKQPYSTGLTATFKKKFEELGGKIVADESYQSGDTQFNGQLTRIKGLNPDGIFMSGYFNEVGPMSRQVRQLGMTADKVTLMGGDGWDSADLISSGGDAIVGGFFCNHYNDKEERPEVKKFLEDYKAANNGNLPGTTMGALGYDATALVLDAIKRVADSGKEINSANVAAAIMETENFHGVSGDITLKGTTGNPAKRALIVEVKKDGFVFSKEYTPAEVLGQ
ncbi:MAG: ABC transporter substrate-binding protein [Armatimonadetes bacterium]|nr:ABC transporter substrate-binding protein [Armatimonadota bacterium]MBX3109266.1 ABC transporter substrate-binding protein [Fimbriimonadaceae bacterium]